MNQDDVKALREFLSNDDFRKEIVEPRYGNYSVKFERLGILVDQAIGELSFVAEHGLSANSSQAESAAVGLWSTLNAIQRDISSGIEKPDWRANTDSHEVNFSTNLKNSLDTFANNKSPYELVAMRKELNEIKSTSQPLSNLVEEAKTVKSQMEILKANAESIVTQIKAKAVDEIVGPNLKLGLIVNSVVAILSLIAGVWQFNLAMQEAVDSKLHVVNAMALSDKVEPLIVLLAPVAMHTIIAAICLKIVFASWNNVLISMHRLFIDKSLNKMIKLVKGSANQEAILSQVMSALIVHQGTGFTKSPVDSGVMPPIIQKISQIPEND